MRCLRVGFVVFWLFFILFLILCWLLFLLLLSVGLVTPSKNIDASKSNNFWYLGFSSSSWIWSLGTETSVWNLIFKNKIIFSLPSRDTSVWCWTFQRVWDTGSLSQMGALTDGRIGPCWAKLKLLIFEVQSSANPLDSLCRCVSFFLLLFFLFFVILSIFGLNLAYFKSIQSLLTSPLTVSFSSSWCVFSSGSVSSSLSSYSTSLGLGVVAVVVVVGALVVVTAFTQQGWGSGRVISWVKK